MNRTELQAELTTRAQAFSPADTDDQLRIRLYAARSQLLERRSAHVRHAEVVLQELVAPGDCFLNTLSVDTILADDNVLFSNQLSQTLLYNLQVQTIGGLAVWLLLHLSAPLGRLRFGPTSYATVTLVTSALLGLLQIVTQAARRLLGVPSLFGERITAVTCREAIMEWVLEMHEHELAPSSRTPPSLLLRRSMLVPQLILAAGSSIFEEVAFRGVLMHGLVSRLRMRRGLAAFLTSAIFGLSHLGNDRGVLPRAIYAAWTFCGGLIFARAYYGTRGGLLLPIALHFVNNAAVFGVSVRKVAQRVLELRRGYDQVMARVSSAHRHPSRSARAVPQAEAPRQPRTTPTAADAGAPSFAADREEQPSTSRLAQSKLVEQR
jgi:membrane protease YdiL (CAAX protease family)